jgi:integrase
VTLAPESLARFERWALTEGRLSPRTTRKSQTYLLFLEARGFPIAARRIPRVRVLALLAHGRGDENIPPRTLNLWVTQLNRWLRFRRAGWTIPAFRDGHVADVPAPTRAEAQKLWAVEWADPSTTARNRAILALFMDCGIRRQELVDLNLGDVFVGRKGPSVRIRRGKGEEERVPPLTRRTFELVDAYVRVHRKATDARALFTTPSGRVSHGYVGNIVTRTGARAGLPWVSCHKLRHFATDDYLDRGVSVTSVAAVLGHKKVETTMLYRSKSLNAQLAESEVRAANGSRFRPSRTAPAAAGEAAPNGGPMIVPTVDWVRIRADVVPGRVDRSGFADGSADGSPVCTWGA